LSLEGKKRRDFIKSSVGVGILGLLGGSTVYFAPLLKSDEPILRPPGAVLEDRFLKLCIKCGQCLQVCPFDSIMLEDIDRGASVGMAYIEPRQRGCYLCEAFPCILACPTGALDHEHDNIRSIHMGIAIINNINFCLAIQEKKPPLEFINTIYEHTKTLSKEEMKSKRVYISEEDSEKAKLQKEILLKFDKEKDKPCDLCVSMCPFPNSENAIGMIKYKSGFIPEIRESCVGCGVCVEVCPVDIIKIVPRMSYEDIYKKDKKNV